MTEVGMGQGKRNGSWNGTRKTRRKLEWDKENVMEVGMGQGKRDGSWNGTRKT